MGMGDYHGDEPEIEACARALRDEYEEANADNWKYEIERFENEN